MWFHLQLLWFEDPSYLQLMWFQNCLVCSLKRLCLQFATDTVALAKLFELFSTTIECVVLNACYSEVQASAIAKHIPYVIGMNKEIGDKAAVKFATGFYNALGAGEGVKFAYKLGCNVIQLDGIPEHLTPVLIKKQ
ncbi:hypothetical protein NIES22_70550 (plasmid) [Calothrix brevissima NIES-22]|nr:hypothetical protein NIES22_70550 [Calothrix brevissima NIES-22]